MMHSTARRGLVAGVVGALTLLGLPSALATTFGTPPAVYTAGGVSAPGGYYAKSGSALTLTVSTDANARCVSVTGLTTQTSSSSKTTWTFAVTAANGADGVQSKTVTIG